MEKKDSLWTLAGGWAVLGAWVAWWDYRRMVRREPTMSEVFYRVSRTKAGVGLILFWFYKFGHLTRLLPERFDIFRRGNMIIFRGNVHVNYKEEATH